MVTLSENLTALKCILKTRGAMVCNLLEWFRTGSSGGLLTSW